MLFYNYWIRQIIRFRLFFDYFYDDEMENSSSGWYAIISYYKRKKKNLLIEIGKQVTKLQLNSFTAEYTQPDLRLGYKSLLMQLAKKHYPLWVPFCFLLSPVCVTVNKTARKPWVWELPSWATHLEGERITDLDAKVYNYIIKYLSFANYPR